MGVIRNVVIWGVLILGSVWDIRKKTMPNWLLLAGAMLGFLLNRIEKQEFLTGLLAVMPGAGFLLLAFITREKIGYGDGLFLMVLGLLAGSQACVSELGIGLFFASLYSLFLWVVKKAKVDTRIPFIPFLGAAHVVLALSGM